MKTIYYLILPAFLMLGCGQPAGKPGSETSRDSSGNARNIFDHPVFTLADAEKILGEPAHLADSTTSSKDEKQAYDLTYTANSKENNNGRRGNLYVMLEQYKDDSSARKVYTSIKKSNEDHGIKILTGVGNEAYFHSDNENFYFVIVRKGNRLFRMKVNKITSYTSEEEFNKITKNVAKDM